MDAVRRLRKQARKYGYLQMNPYCSVVETDGFVEILPVNQARIYVHYYDPLVVFGPHAPGFFVGAAIRWGPAVIITAGFFPFGWVHPYFLRHRTLAQPRLRRGGRIKDQMIMLYSSMRDSRAEWFHTFASVRTMGFRPTAPPA